MWDIDGNEYIDYVGSWGSAIICHVDDEVLAALAETMKKGTSFGAPCLLENIVAEMVISVVPSIEMVRFVNSGTEACMGLLRLACAFTGREKIIKFEGCYHGHADPFLVKAGSGVSPLGLPDSPGDDDFIPPMPEFLNALRRITKDNGVFRHNSRLDTLRKIIGGGLPVGAYGGKREIMEMAAPAGPMYQAGILSGNPLAMTFGIHTLKRLKQPETYDHLNTISSKLIQGIVDARKKVGHAICGGYISGMFGFFFTESPFYNFEDSKKSDNAKFARFYR
ncbi:unnamed protein product [Fraxinus pennsylvanica]|uniref:Glutamate-1-semialdehyde 2,1-aminomutase n=1 Tax=Fraxinus pennsylvanica TaxID=56036 RepID=A0AAD2ADC1_9LAMI|nr:unnamed protein product [Fraxinus pennsylvanica]